MSCGGSHLLKNRGPRYLRISTKAVCVGENAYSAEENRWRDQTIPSRRRWSRKGKGLSRSGKVKEIRRRTGSISRHCSLKWDHSTLLIECPQLSAQEFELHSKPPRIRSVPSRARRNHHPEFLLESDSIWQVRSVGNPSSKIISYRFTTIRNSRGVSP